MNTISESIKISIFAVISSAIFFLAVLLPDMSSAGVPKTIFSLALFALISSAIFYFTNKKIGKKDIE